MKALSLLFTRMATISLAILVQIIIFFLAFGILGDKFPVIYIVMVAFSIIIVI